MYKYELSTTTEFKREYKKMVKRKYNMKLLDDYCRKASERRKAASGE